MDIFLDDFVDYELNMLKNCEIVGLLGFKSIGEGEGVRLIYDDKYYPLFFKGDKISTFMCNKIFRTLKTLYYSLGNYLLEPKKLDLNLDSLMVNDEGEIAFIYLPEKIEGADFFAKLEVMIKELVAHMEDDEKILKAMHNLAVNDKFSEKNVDYFFDLFK